MTGLVLAVRYLTIVPLPGRAAHGVDALGRAAGWFPVVGLGLGLVLVGVERVASILFPSLLAALLTVTAWKVLTGGLHLDGLADCLDGLVGRDAEHRLSIMRDSRIGAFGAVGLILFLLLEIAAVAELPAGLRWRALLVVPALARATPPLLARCFRAAKVEGHGAAFRSGLRAGAAPVALIPALALVWAGLGVAGLTAVFTSDVARARRTAEIIAAPHGLTPAVIPALREMAMGRWDGRTAEEIRGSEPAAFADWMARVGEFPFPEGESVPDLRARAWPAFEAIIGAHAGESVAIVAHGGTNRALLCTALGLELRRLLALGQDYGALSVLARVAAGWRLVRLNELPML